MKEYLTYLHLSQTKTKGVARLNCHETISHAQATFSIPNIPQISFQMSILIKDKITAGLS